MPVTDAAAFVIVEQAQRDALDDRDRQTDCQGINLIRHRREDVAGHGCAIAEIRERGRCREAITRRAACIEVVPIDVETHAAECATQRRTGVVVTLPVVGPPALTVRIGRAAERRIRSGFLIVDVGQAQFGPIISVVDAGIRRRRRLPFPLQRHPECVVALAAEHGVVIVPVAAQRCAERHVVARHDRGHEIDLVLVAAADIVLAQRIDGMCRHAAGRCDETGQADRVGEVIRVVVVAVPGLFQIGDVRAQGQPIQGPVDPGQLNAVVIDLAAFAIGWFVAVVRVSGAERVVEPKLPVGTERAFDCLHVEWQAAHPGDARSAGEWIPEAGFAGHDAALRAVLADIAVLSGQRVVRQVDIAIVLAVETQAAAHGQVRARLQHDAAVE